MIDLYLDLDLQMQVVVSYFHLYHTTDLALKNNLRRHNDRKIWVRSIIQRLNWFWPWIWKYDLDTATSSHHYNPAHCKTSFKKKQTDHAIRNREFIKQNRNFHIVLLDLHTKRITLTSHLVKTISNRLGKPETTTIGPKFVKIGARDYKTWLFPFEGSGHLW